MAPVKMTDLSPESRSLAWRLRGARFNEADLYVMINSHERPIQFHVQEGLASNWLRLVDTSLASPLDIAEAGRETPLASLDYEAGGRSVVVLTRAGQSVARAAS